MRYTLMHEHITIDLSGVKNDDDCKLDCKDETIKELETLFKQGVRRILDVTNIGMGRNIEYVQEIAKKTNIEILMSTGCYKEPFFPQEVISKTVEELAEIFIKEIEEGIEGTDIKAKVIGEIGTSNNEMFDTENKLFRSAVIAHKRTNAPIYTHTTLGTLAKKQADFFKEQNVDLSKVIIGHIDLTKDIDTIREVLKTGVNVGFDTIGKINYFKDTDRAEFLKVLCDEGFANQIVLSLDLTRKSHLKYKGGIGYAYLVDTFLPMLREVGVSENNIEKMLVQNPDRILG